MFDLGFIRKKGKVRTDAVPRTLSDELLEELTGACQLPDANQGDRRAFGRICIGTRAMLCAATENSQTVSVLLRDLCVASAGILVDSPLPTGEEYWLYIPKAQDPDDVVALCCVIVRCDPGGFERSAYVAAASFIEGQPPALASPEAEQRAGSPNQAEEEGHRPFVPRPGSTLFLPSTDPTTAPQATAPPAAEQSPAAEPAPAEAAPVATSVDIVATTAAPMPVEIVTPAPAPQPVDAVVPAPPQPPPSGPPPVVNEPAPQVVPHVQPPSENGADIAPLSPQQIRRMADTVKPHLAYLKRMINRMEQQGIGPDDPMRQEMHKAYDAVEQLHRRLEANAGAADKPAVKHSSQSARPRNDAIESLMLLRRTALLPSIN